MKRRWGRGAAALAMMVVASMGANGPVAAQVTEQTFRGGRTGDLAALCAAGPADPMQSNALAWCHGFILGAGQYHHTVTAEGGRQGPVFCLPTPEPTLDQARAGFVAWAAAHPQFAAEKAVDGLMRFAADTYPCPRGRARPRR